MYQNMVERRKFYYSELRSQTRIESIIHQDNQKTNFVINIIYTYVTQLCDQIRSKCDNIINNHLRLS